MCPGQILVYRLSHKRHKRRDQFLQRFKTLIERQISGLFIRARFAFPEPSPVSSDVPVTELVNETFNGLPGFSCVIGIERGGGCFNRMVEQCERPAIDFGTLSYRNILRQINVVEGRIQGKKGVTIPKGVDE